jgi:hypothetical protein
VVCVGVFPLRRCYKRHQIGLAGIACTCWVGEHCVLNLTPFVLLNDCAFPLCWLPADDCDNYVANDTKDSHIALLRKQLAASEDHSHGAHVTRPHSLTRSGRVMRPTIAKESLEERRVRDCSRLSPFFVCCCCSFLLLLIHGSIVPTPILCRCASRCACAKA